MSSVRATVLTAAAQVAMLLGAAALGVLIAHEFTTGPATDGFFFTNAIYGIVVFVSQSLRTTAVAGLLSRGHVDRERLGVHLRAVALLALVAAAVYAIAALAVIPAALEPEARDTARTCLLILWPCSATQLVGGVAAAALSGVGDHRSPALAYGTGAIVTVVACVALISPLGIEAVPAALLAGAIVATAWMTLALARRHAIEDVPDGEPARRPHAVAVRLLLGAVSLIAAQIVLTISVAFAAGVGHGAATVFSYAQMATAMLTAALATPVTVVFAPVVARGAGDDRVALADLADRAFRAAITAVPSAVAALCLVGPPIADRVLTGMTGAQIDELFRLVLLMSPSVVAAQLMMIPLLGVITRERLGRLAAASGAIAAVHAGLCAAAVALWPHSLTGVAVAADVSSFALAGVALGLSLRRMGATSLWRAVRAFVAIAAPGALAYAVAAVALQPGGRLPQGVAAFAVGTVVHAAWLHVRHGHELRDVLARLRPAARPG